MDPIYYRFALKPSDGSVLLSHNQEGHPARVRTHADLAQEGNEPGMVHGYAYRIRGGWRLHDYEHRPLTDPFVKAQVSKAIRQAEGGKAEVEKRQQPFPEGMRFHYGLPV